MSSNVSSEIRIVRGDLETIKSQLKLYETVYHVDSYLFITRISETEFKYSRLQSDPDAWSNAKNIEFREYLSGISTLGTGNFANLQTLAEMPIVSYLGIANSPTITMSGASVRVIPNTVISGNIALGLTSDYKNGSYLADSLTGSLGVHSATDFISDANGNVWNLSRVVDSALLTPIFNGTNQQIWALTQAKSTVVDGDLIGAAGSENLQVSFVVKNGTGFTEQGVSGSIKIQFARLHCLLSLPTDGVVLSIHSDGDMRFDPPLTGGADIPTSQTKLSLSQTIATGTFSVTASGVGYVHSGDAGNLGVSETDFNTRESKQIYLNGRLLIKGIDVIWQSATSFQYAGTVDADDIFIIIS